MWNEMVAQQAEIEFKYSLLQQETTSNRFDLETQSKL